MNKAVLLLALALAGCSAPSTRQLSQRSDARLSEVVHKNADSAAYCPSAKTGETCLMNWDQAVNYCKSQHGHLPTAREWAEQIERFGTRTLETSEVKGTPPAGYYLVDCLNPDGSLDAFYMNHTEYKRPAGDTANYLLWTASLPPQHTEYAHVYYNEWGGGGGNPQDHRLTHANAFQCVVGE